MFKTRFISMLVLLMTAVTGAWAQDTYKIDAVYTYTANGQSQSQDLSIDDAASLPFTIKLSELDPYSMSNEEYNLDATNITVSGDNIEKGTDANWDTEITFNGAGTATVSYGIQHSVYGDLGSVTITFTVTKNAPTPAGYTVSMPQDTPDAEKWTARAGTDGTYQELPLEGVAAGTAVSLKYGGALKVKSVKAVKKAAAPALNLTSPAVGQVIGDDGKNYAAGSVPTGVTAVAMIAYLSGSNGLAIALAVEGSLNWETAISTCEAKTPAFTNGTWKLPSQEEWKQMFSANGGSDESYTGLNTAITNAGGTAFRDDIDDYWTSTPYSDDKAYHVYLFGGGPRWFNDAKGTNYLARAVLAF